MNRQGEIRGAVRDTPSSIPIPVLIVFTETLVEIGEIVTDYRHLNHVPQAHTHERPEINKSVAGDWDRVLPLPTLVSENTTMTTRSDTHEGLHQTRHPDIALRVLVDTLTVGPHIAIVDRCPVVENSPHERL
ncbi:hypothetical protein PC116_g29850 [Phytophthora cactorum]|nr:hypothetical protein PC116_g29850 [Phytophthora cactorum]